MALSRKSLLTWTQTFTFALGWFLLELQGSDSVFSPPSYPCLLHELIQFQDFKYHLSINNSQIRISRPDFSPELQIHIPSCLSDTSTQRSNRHLKLNASKTQLLIFSRKPALSTVFLISVKGNSILQVKPIKTNQPNKNPGITPNSTLTPHPVYQQILNCLSIFRNLPLVIASAAIILLKATVTSLLDSCRSLLIGLLTSTLVPFIHSHDRSQSDLDKTTDHIIHLSHCHAVLQPHWDRSGAQDVF